jgi:hypothetical protein
MRHSIEAKQTGAGLVACRKIRQCHHERNTNSTKKGITPGSEKIAKQLSKETGRIIASERIKKKILKIFA